MVYLLMRAARGVASRTEMKGEQESSVTIRSLLTVQLVTGAGRRVRVLVSESSIDCSVSSREVIFGLFQC